MTALIHDYRDTPDTMSASAATGFAVRVHRNGPGTVVVVYGEVDLATAPLVHQAARGALHRSSKPLHLDLRRVTFFDCAGLGMLIALRNATLHTNTTPPRITTSHAVRRVIDLAGLTNLLDLDPPPHHPGDEGGREPMTTPPPNSDTPPSPNSSAPNTS